MFIYEEVTVSACSLWAPSCSYIHFIPGFPLLLSTALHNYCVLLLVTEQFHTAHARSFSILLHNIQLHPTQAETASPRHPTHSVLSAARASEWGSWHISEWCGVAFCSSTSNHPNYLYCTWVFIKWDYRCCNDWNTHCISIYLWRGTICLPHFNFVIRLLQCTFGTLKQSYISTSREELHTQSHCGVVVLKEACWCDA